MKKRTKIELVIFAVVAVFYFASLFSERSGQADAGSSTATSTETFISSRSNEHDAAEDNAGINTSSSDGSVTGDAGSAAASDASKDEAEDKITDKAAVTDDSKNTASGTDLNADATELSYAGINMRPLEDVLSETAESISEDGSYTDRDSVAMYIAAYGHLPGNYITKSEAKAAGWISEEGNLNEVCPGKSIGGDRFGNYEGGLPDEKGRKYFECDINYDPNNGYRGGERIIYSNDGLIYYTADHYKTFEKLYGDT